MPIVDASAWNQFVQSHPESHALQSLAWGKLKDKFGWQSKHVIVGDAGAQVLFKSLPLGYSLAYIPKGPIGENWSELIKEIDELCRKQRAVFLKVEPDSWEDEFSMDISQYGFKRSNHEIQPARTIVLDISGSEDDILGQMKQKTRYNIRLAGKKKVVVSKTEDIESFSAMMEVTGERDGFGVHSLPYYQKAYDLFSIDDNCALFIAKYEEESLGGLMVFSSGKRAWYFYGASTNKHRNRMPTYLLQWEAILWAKKKGCTEYDLWGVPDHDEDFLEENFMDRNEGLWGVYRFKRGFGGQVRRTIGAWDKVYIPALYTIYQGIISRRSFG